MQTQIMPSTPQEVQTLVAHDRRPASATPLRRVLMTSDAVGGVWTFCFDLAAFLSNQGIEVLFVVMGPRPDRAQRRSLAELTNVTLVESPLALEWMDDPWEDIDRAGAWLLDLEERFAPDVVHLNQYAHGNLRWRAPVIVTGHSCVLSWWRAVRGEEAPSSWSVYAARVRAGLRGANAVTAPTHAMLQELRKCYGRLPAAQVIHNGRDARRFSRGAKRNLIACMGRLWDEGKNVGLFDEAAEGLAADCCLIGSTQAPDGRVVAPRFAKPLGQLCADEVALWLSRTAIFCSPALYEPFGLAALEAGLSGCALVLSDIPSFREVWHDAAVFVDPRDVHQLHRTLEALTDDVQLRLQLADAALHRARSLASGAWAQSYLSLYEATVRSHGNAKEGLQ